MTFAVIVPMFNEQRSIGATLEALRTQTLPTFRVVLCDNDSTDLTMDVVQTFISQHALPWSVVSEARKGTGAAADTAVRAAIRDGATVIARTDADCLPAADWAETILRRFEGGRVDLIAGWTKPRRDENLSAPRYVFLMFLTELAMVFGKVRPSNRGPQYLGPYVMTQGNNVAFTSALYERVGGFTRTAIEEGHEDRALILAVREVTDRYEFRRDVVVRASARRLQAWGVKRSLQWYAGHLFNVENVDIR
jgi:glycosyltransferase involved in cell wall biosynthesis